MVYYDDDKWYFEAVYQNLIYIFMTHYRYIVCRVDKWVVTHEIMVTGLRLLNDYYVCHMRFYILLMRLHIVWCCHGTMLYLNEVCRCLFLFVLLFRMDENITRKLLSLSLDLFFKIFIFRVTFLLFFSIAVSLRFRVGLLLQYVALFQSGN